MEGAKKVKSGKRTSIIIEVAILFLLGVILNGVITYYSEHRITDRAVRSQAISMAAGIAGEVETSVKENPNWQWLMGYWHDHAADMDIEYDVDFRSFTRTEEKVKKWIKSHPDIPLRYTEYADIRYLSEEDQKLYAEIQYTWLITRLNQIKSANNIEFVYVVMTDNTYSFQFFVLSAADPGAVRGDKYGNFYKNGKRVTATGGLSGAMRDARENSSNLVRTGTFFDYYDYLGMVNDYNILTGITLNSDKLLADIKETTRQRTMLAMTYQILLSLICLLLILLFVIRPLRKVQQSIRIYKSTKKSEEVIRALSKVRSYNEIGQLADDVSGLAVEIDEYVDEIQNITAERERIGAELSVASRIQTSMLPSTFPPFPDRDGFDIYASMEPAKEVGGDFYDFFFVDDDHLCMVIADVAGKGVPAALFMMACKIILANNAKMGKSPAQILNDSNVSICSNNPEEMFITVWIGIFEISTGKLTAANAGHEYPVIRHPGGDFEVFKDPHGFILGGLNAFRYKEYELELEPGASLFVYTDGVPEATDGQEQLFGLERMVDALNSDSDTAPENVLARVREAVGVFVAGAEQFDDLTMMCLTYKGKQEGEIS